MWIIQVLSTVDLGHTLLIIFPSVLANIYNNTWPLGDLLCRLTFANKYTFLIGNVLLITLLSLNRLFRCLYPLRSASRASKPRVKASLTLGLCLAMLVVPSWTTFITFYNRDIGFIAYSSLQSQCQFDLYLNTTWRKADMVFEKAAFAIFDFVPTIVMIGANAVLIVVAIKTQLRIETQRRHQKSAIVILVTVTFLMTTLPLFIWHYFYSNSHPVAFNTFFARTILCLKMIPSFSNPLIYFANNKSFRRFTIWKTRNFFVQDIQRIRSPFNSDVYMDAARARIQRIRNRRSTDRVTLNNVLIQTSNNKSSIDSRVHVNTIATSTSLARSSNINKEPLDNEVKITKNSASGSSLDDPWALRRQSFVTLSRRTITL